MSDWLGGMGLNVQAAARARIAASEHLKRYAWLGMAHRVGPGDTLSIDP